MKTILTTDFTNASKNAIEYAIRLLHNGKDVKYKLLHAYKPMAPYAEVSSIPVMENVAWKTDLKKKLHQLSEELESKYQLNVEPVLKRGGVYEVIHRLEKKSDTPDLIVMATREKSLFERLTFGSNALQVAEHSETPVLIVPKEAQQKTPATVAFATDLKPLDIPYESLKLAKEIIKKYNARLDVVHVYENEEEQATSENLKESAIHRYLEEIEHNHIPIINENVYDGIISYIENHQPDMLVIIPRDHNFFEKIFGERITKKMTYHTSTPLLVLN